MKVITEYFIDQRHKRVSRMNHIVWRGDYRTMVGWTALLCLLLAAGMFALIFWGPQ